MPSFSGSRLALARKRRGFTKRSLAESAEISTKTLTNYESPNQDQKPSERTIQKLSKCLDFPVNFFYGEDVDEIKAEAVNFRARTKMTQRQRDYALSAGSLALLLSDWMDVHFNLPKTDVPLCEEIGPSTAAEYVRNIWGLGVQPISNMVSLLELHGVRVFSLYESHVNIDAFSFWDRERNTPIILLSTSKSGERGRMDAAHELGHLVMHRNIDIVHSADRDFEKEANEFASSFLMPETDIRAYAPRNGILEDYIQAKKRWKVSVSALIYRTWKLNILTDWRYHSLYKQLSSAGMRTKEPKGIVREDSQVLQKIFDLSKKEGRSAFSISKDLNIPYEELARLAFKTPIKKISCDHRADFTPRKGARVEVSVIRQTRDIGYK